MNTQLLMLDQSIEKYSDIQEKHIRAFETELMPDLESQNFERAYAFADMKNKFNEFLSTIQNNKDDIRINYRDTAASYIAKITKILESDAILKKKILIYQKQLKQHLNDTGKVRTAFNGYAASTGADKYIAFSLTS